MPVNVVIAAAAVAVSFPVFWWALASSRESGSAAVARNLASGPSPLSDLRRVFLEKSAGERAMQPAVRALARKARRVTPAGMVESLDTKLHLAGMSTWGLERALAAKLGLGALGTIAGFFIWVGSPSMVTLLSWVLAAACGYFAPDAVLGGRAQKRQQEIERELPDTLDQITISVEAGLGFEASLAQVAQTGTGPLADEIARTLQDIRLGVPRAQALDKLVERTDANDLMRFVHAMRQAEGYGIPIAQVLRVQSAELRDKRKQRAEEKAMKVPVKIVFPVVLCIFPTLFIVILGPAAIQLMSNWPD